MDKRYTVFISSPFEDLKEERQKVIQTLLELGCIPCGMELFPASNQDQWSFIQKVIDDCDYYILILGGRYGSCCTDGIGYTEKEYLYAIQKGKPCLAFLHQDPSGLPSRCTEQTKAGRLRLSQFRRKVEEHLCRYWTDGDLLAAEVAKSMSQLIQACPAKGWIRAGSDEGKDLQTLQDLREENRRLRQKLHTETVSFSQKGIQSVRLHLDLEIHADGEYTTIQWHSEE
ncbi:DUF4062 domain-containing protein [[Clostridium] leptum]|nr:DUF4062 domain-containing protein [[Clostridium] leptum]